MQIKLYMDGEKKTFSVPFIKARMLRNAIVLNEQMSDSKDTSTEDIDAMAEFVVELFNNQFSIDELWDGLSTEEFIPELMRCMEECMKVKQTDPNSRKRSR